MRRFFVAMAIALGAGLPSAARAADVAPPVPLRVPDVCPRDACRYGPWTATAPLDVFAREGLVGRPIFRLRAGERFMALTGHLHVRKAAKLRVAETFAWPPGSRNPFDRYTRGSTAWVLAPRGDRYYDVWYRGRRRGIRAFVGRGGWFMPGRDQLQEVEPGDWTWWVEVQRADGRRGWLMFPGARAPGVKELAG